MRSSVFGAALAAFSVMGVGAASAATFVDPGPGFDDASFVDLLGLDVGDFAEDFVVESRGGNNGLSGAWELSVFEVEPPSTVVNSQRTNANFEWNNGAPSDFSLEFDGSKATYTLGGTMIMQSGLDDLASIDTIYLRTRSEGSAPSNSVTLSDLMISGPGFADMDFAGALTSADGGATYLIIRDIVGPFTLTGKQTMAWTGMNPPSNSRLSAQIKVGATIVPLPAAAPLLAAGVGVLALFGAWRRRAR